ncbi:retromer complex subunit Vps35, partial [Coemansia sp. RSA 1694]
IMMDMLEMTRGVQHPTRGLFLRYYLGQMTKDYLPLCGGDGPGGNLEDSTHFILTNFVEMNKLWVRLQHQGLSRDKERREAERRDLRTLVGSNLLRLASLGGVSRSTYEEAILPRLLSQVVSCRDTLAQEYLMEALVQAFSDEWHLATIGQLMEAITGLSPKVSIKTIVIPLVDRVSAYASRRREEKGKGSPTPSNRNSDDEEDRDNAPAAPEANGPEASQALSPESAGKASPELVKGRSRSASDVEATSADAGTDQDSGVQEAAQMLASVHLDDTDNSSNAAAAEEEGEETENAKAAVVDEPALGKRSEIDALASLFSSFWSHVSGLIESRPDLPLHDAIAICAAMLRLSLACNPKPAEPVDSVLAFVREQLRARDLSPGAHNPATTNQLLSLLLGPLRAYANPLKVERAHAERVDHERSAIEQHNNGDKVLAHLQRSLKVADSCLDPVLSVRLFVELLNQSTMHYERRCLAVTPKYVNDLIDLIRTSTASIEAFDSSAPEPTRAAADAGVADVNALYSPETPMNAYVLQYFRRTLEYIQSRKDLAASGSYDLPDFSAIRCEEPEDERSSYF